MFTRVEALIGKDKLEFLKTKKVCVFGIGGVGGIIVESLVRSGIGEIGIVDADIVDISNKNRQIIALDSTLNKLKVEVMFDRLKDINPNVKIKCYPYFYGVDEKISNEKIKIDKINSMKCEVYKDVDLEYYDYIIDAIDTVTAKISIITECVDKNIKIISSMGTANRLDENKLFIMDISKTNTCKLAKVVRTTLRKKGINKGVPVLCSTEIPKKNNGVLGSISYVTSSAGLKIAGYVIRDLLKGESR